MNNRKNLKIGTIAAAFVLSVVAISVAFAAYTSSLNIKGSGTVKAAKWKVIFKDLGDAWSGNSNGVTATVKQITAPSISGETSIGTYNVEFKTPGDYIGYTFTIKNAGDFPAKIAEGFTLPKPICTKGTSGTDTDATNVCANLQYELKYDVTGIWPAVAAGDTFGVGEEKVVVLTLTYNKTATADKLPTGDVTISNLNFTIPFVQY